MTIRDLINWVLDQSVLWLLLLIPWWLISGAVAYLVNDR